FPISAHYTDSVARGVEVSPVRERQTLFGMRKQPVGHSSVFRGGRLRASTSTRPRRRASPTPEKTSVQAARSRSSAALVSIWTCCSDCWLSFETVVSSQEFDA